MQKHRHWENLPILGRLLSFILVISMASSFNFRGKRHFQLDSKAPCMKVSQNDLQHNSSLFTLVFHIVKTKFQIKFPSPYHLLRYATLDRNNRAVESSSVSGYIRYTVFHNLNLGCTVTVMHGCSLY